MDHVKQSYYKYCIVPLCTNTTSNCKDKLYFSVPKDPAIRKSWTRAMKRDEKLNPQLSSKSSLWCCEDHFSLQDDMENYMQWAITKDIKRLKLKPGTLPHIFDCQKKNIVAPVERKGAKKRKHLSLVEEALSSPASIPSSSAAHLQDECPPISVFEVTKFDKSHQTNLKKPFRSKSTMAVPEVNSVACSPIKCLKSISESFVPHSISSKGSRGFKNISVLLEQRGCSLIRPPSVSASTISTKTEVKESKRIAALRIHVERVIGRLRDFSMLSPHACVDNHFLHVLDYAVIVSCGLINMQDHLIKKQI